MDKFTLCFILTAAICIEGTWCKTRKHSDGGKIVGGNETTIQKYPYQAYLLLFDGSNYYQCGGSIVSKRHIVTAAHCLFGIQRIYVRIGSTNADSGGTEYQTTQFKTHPLYNKNTSDYDVGVVKIPKDMNLDGRNAKTIKLVKSGQDPKEGDIMTLTGWGATSQNGDVSATLMVVEVPVVSWERCNQLYHSGITNRMFCAGLDEGGKDTCQGDSGGPAVSHHLLNGITSFGYGCAQPNAPGVYARVGNREIRSFIKWHTGV